MFATLALVATASFLAPGAPALNVVSARTAPVARAADASMLFNFQGKVAPTKSVAKKAPKATAGNQKVKQTAKIFVRASARERTAPRVFHHTHLAPPPRHFAEPLAQEERAPSI